jgi:hypothetical protein
LSARDVELLYRFLLGRAPTEQELKDRLADRAVDVARASIVASQEFASQEDRWCATHPLVVFHHVPKTGGRSFHAIARELYGNTHYWRRARQGQSIRQDAHSSPEVLRYVPLVGGHMHYIPELFADLGRLVIYLATMRDSVSRAISAYNFIRAHPDHPMHSDLSSRSFCEALTQIQKFRNKVCGYQMRVMFGRRTSAADRQELLQRERYVIGKLDHFDQFISYVGNHVFAQPNLAIPHENSASRSYKEEVRNQPDFEKALQLLNSENAEEMQFYNSFGEILVSDYRSSLQYILRG